jgi:hypothetical protein
VAEGKEKQIQDLYRLPAGEFIAARDALVKELRLAKDKDAAARVKALRRPTVAAWALNQLIGDHRELAGLIESGATLRAAQEETLGGGDRTAMRAATEARRAIIDRLTKRALQTLADADLKPNQSHRDAIASTLEAATVDPDVADLLIAGRLEREAESPSGFGGLDFVADASRVRPRQAADDSQVRDATTGSEPATHHAEPRVSLEQQRKEREARAAEAKQAAQREKAEARRREQEDEAERARARALAAAQREVDRLERELAAARDRLDILQGRAES